MKFVLLTSSTYMAAPLRGVVSMDGNTVSPAPVQVSLSFLFFYNSSVLIDMGFDFSETMYWLIEIYFHLVVFGCFGASLSCSIAHMIKSVFLLSLAFAAPVLSPEAQKVCNAFLHCSQHSLPPAIHEDEPVLATCSWFCCIVVWGQTL